MTQPEVSLRSAEPTLEEGRIFARYLDRAAEGFFRIMLGRRSVDIVATAFMRPGHDLSHRHVTFAERDGVVVGMVSGYTSEQHRRSSERPLREAAGRWNFRLTIVSLLFAPMLRIIDTIADGDFYLQAVAVDPNARGGGIGSTLIDHIEARAVAEGSSRLALDVSGKNAGARKLYERRGMTVEAQWPKHLSIPGLQLLRMVKAL